MRRTLAVLTIILLALTSCSDDGGGNANNDDPAAQALAKQIDQIGKGQYGALYDTLHPAQQALVDEPTFIGCYQDSAASTLRSVSLDDVEEIYDETIKVPGTDATVEAKAITAKVSANGQSDTDTFHEVDVDGTWRWTWSGIDDCVG